MRQSLLILGFWVIGVAYCLGQQASFQPVPALSYHNVRPYSTQDPAYFIDPERLEEHMKKLKDLGFQSVLPEHIEASFYQGKKLSAKPILISFDDTRADHFLAAAPILEKFGFRGVFYIMTVSIGKSGYMTNSQIKELSDRGHAIGLHTWDHQDLRKLPEDQWKIQIDKPKALLEEVTGRKVTSLAYPFGLWNSKAVQELKSRGLRSAFQLGGKMDPIDPIFTMPRILVPGNWSAERLVKEIDSRF
ncbi:MAG: polysaccharide deacetylase family protein [Algoriphagus sp.]|nr:polysaccharide deacetylase family protein [Algoriphagus sp.]